MRETTRRGFTKTAAATVGGCAVLGVSDSASAATSHEIKQFVGLVGKNFRIIDALHQEHHLRLTEVSEHRSDLDTERPRDLPRQHGFSLFFSAPKEQFDCSHACRIDNAAFKGEAILISSVDHDGSLEVAFN